MYFQQRIQNLLNSHQTPYTLEHPIEEKSELEKSVELFCETAKQFQNMWDSSPQPNFEESYASFPVTPFQTTQPPILEMNMEPLRESEQQSQNQMDSRLNHNFQN